MYVRRLTKVIEVDLKQKHDYLVNQLKFHQGNDCVVSHKELDRLFGKISRVDNYHFSLGDSSLRISYRDVTDMTIFQNYEK